MSRFVVPVPAMTIRHTVEGRRTIGLRVEYHRPGQIPDLLRRLERQIYLHCGKVGVDLEGPGVVLLGIVMPCGHRYMFHRWEDIPQESMLCVCGNRDHLVLSYEKIEAAAPVAIWP